MTPGPDRPAAELMRLVNGYQVAQAIHVAAVLGIADQLRPGPQGIDQLAAAVGAHPGTLYRVLRALAAVGVFNEDAGRRFSLAPMGECLCSDAAEPVGPWAENIGRPYSWLAWAHLLQSTRNGETAFDAVYGESIWEYRASHLDDGAAFDRAMATLSQNIACAVTAVYDLSMFRRIVDVGGGRGALLAGILAAHPGVRGVLFDQPHVVADHDLARLGVANRCEVVGGSFFDAVPAGDIHVLKAILHDWDDARAIEILRCCGRTAGRILVLDRVLAGPNEGAEGKFADLNMLVGPGGQERTADEFAALFAAAGFRLTRILPTGTRLSVIEGVPG